MKCTNPSSANTWHDTKWNTRASAAAATATPATVQGGPNKPGARGCGTENHLLLLLLRRLLLQWLLRLLLLR